MSKLEDLTSWHSDWSNTKVVVFGLGVSGFSVADTLVELGSNVIVIADKADQEQLKVLEVLGVETFIGQTTEENMKTLQSFEADLLITSPGIKPTNELLLEAARLSVPIWTDIDLAWRVRDKFGNGSEWICITGTNGKTTVTQLVEGMLLAAGVRASACGNIGIPILDAIRHPAEFEALVVELSSFQLHYIQHIEPLVSAVLNIAEDHLDWHGSMEVYAATKGKIYNNTRIACVYNSLDSKTSELLAKSQNNADAQAVGFTVMTPTPNELGWVEDILVDRAYVDTRDVADEIATISDLKNIPVISPHLLANVAAASAIARGAGVQPEEIRNALQIFRLDAHRIELVLAANDIRWVDDSKATNPHAADAALSSFDSVVWVVGGLLKGVDIAPLVQKHKEKLKAALVIGVEREPVLAALREFAPDCQIIEVTVEKSEVMTEVVRVARELAKSGDVVLLAPAAASMDQFIDYADRGNAFAKAVLEEKK
jgi:UDP-N-acetylmuramoylalanine--D-glutamate ligase